MYLSLYISIYIYRYITVYIYNILYCNITCIYIYIYTLCIYIYIYICIHIYFASPAKDATSLSPVMVISGDEVIEPQSARGQFSQTQRSKLHAESFQVPLKVQARESEPSRQIELPKTCYLFPKSSRHQGPKSMLTSSLPTRNSYSHRVIETGSTDRVVEPPLHQNPARSVAKAPHLETLNKQTQVASATRTSARKPLRHTESMRAGRLRASLQFKALFPAMNNNNEICHYFHYNYYHH